MSDSTNRDALGAPGELVPLAARRLGLHTQREDVAIVHRDCSVARSEGLSGRSRVELRANRKRAVARLYQVDNGMVAPDSIGLSESAWHKLRLDEGEGVTLHHARDTGSMRALRGKVYGHRLSQRDASAIFRDIVDGKLSDVQIAAFVAALASHAPERTEITALTHAMVAIGERLSWPGEVVVDKHCVGGLPGNRTTPIVVSIVAAAGLTIPKTSSRAITSPAGTADTVETMTRVDLGVKDMRRVVEQEGGCLVWGGGIDLSPADDLLIRVEHELELDCTSQMVASVLSKKIAAGSTHVLIDVPVGPTAKVRSRADADELAMFMRGVGEAFGLTVRTVMSDGLQPVGDGIGPALEARDVLAVLENDPHAPQELRTRALGLAAAVLEMGGACATGSGIGAATAILDEGRALAKFMAICEAQGGFRRPGIAPFTKVIESERPGHVADIDNRRLARLAKLAGAPQAPTAGVALHVNLGDGISRGQPLLTLHGESRGELDYAIDYYQTNTNLIEVRAK
ncbi:thymidine phosphorylase family protein [Qipengyuania sp. 1NDH17]|uniref:Putative thymidine phosphorylase n=1 Tax=Qipengyuania polymorpha TaxID=2867234 RepID=A0ABS7J3Y0_9SPHN|nr:thymidine phosphorylase family protein [Qipengyuania polymorpha]MBX7459270.1 thymidine phosphorylase family protein [Qipengyuania polymorpha]